MTDVTLNGRTATWRYDPNGNLLADGGNHYTWDAENRLLSITDTATGQVVEFAYDGLDRRVAMTRNGYLWCGEILCTARDNTGAIKARYLPQGETAGATSYYYARDNLGSVMAMLDSQGTAKGSATYDAYGRTVATTGVAPAFGYAGMFRPIEGAYLTYYRGYSPEVGRWISRDPIGEAGGINLYAYVGGNPISFIDPLGLVELNLFPPNQSIHQNAQNYHSPPGIYSVGAHGSESSISNQYGAPVSPGELANLIQNDPNSEAKTVQLMSCNTGKGNSSYASQLAKALGRPVLGPNGYVGFSPAGNTAVNQSPNMTGTPGRYNIFNP